MSSNPFIVGGRPVSDADGWINVTTWARHRGVSSSYLFEILRKNFLGCFQVRNCNAAYRVKFPECDLYMTLAKKCKAEGRPLPAPSWDLFKDEAMEVSSPVRGEFDPQPPRSSEPVSAQDIPDIDKVSGEETAKNKKLHYAAENERLKFEKASGELIYRDIVRKEIFEVTRRVRNKLLSFPARVSSEVSVMSEPGDVERYLQSEIVDLLTELSDSLSSLSFDSNDYGEGKGDE